MAYNVNLPAGRYQAHAIAAGAYESKSGALMVGVQWQLHNPAGDSITSHTCLISKTGVVQEKRIARIMEWATGWDGVSMEWFGQHFNELKAELVIERRFDATDGTEKPEVAFINPVGGSGVFAIPNTDPTALASKFGAMLRAVAGSKPRPVKVQQAPAKNPAGTPRKRPEVATDGEDLTQRQQDAWNAFLTHYTGDAADRETAWFNLIKTAVPGKENYTTFVATDWDAVMNAINNPTPAPIDDDDMPF